MNPTELLVMVQGHGYVARLGGDEVQFHTCLFCGNDRWNLELNARRGVYSCWACQQSGTVRGFLRQFTGEDVDIPVDLDADRVRSNIVQAKASELKSAALVPSAFAWLQRRGLNREAIFCYGLSVCVAPEALLYGRITVPGLSYHEGTLLGRVGRAYDGSTPKYMSDMAEKRILGFRRSVEQRGIHVLVEGPFDAIQVNRAGMSAAALQGTDNPEVEEWAARVKGDEVIVILLDGSAGMEAERLKWKLKNVHPDVRVVSLPEAVDPGELEIVVIRKLMERVFA